MSVKIMGLVWDYKIPRDEKFILLAYADHASHDGTGVYPAVKTISEKTGYSERSVQSITRKLQTMGLLIPDGKGPHGTNKWAIPIQWGAETAPANSAGVQNTTFTSGAKNDTPGVQPTAPESSYNQEQPSIKAQKPTIPPEILIYREVTHLYPPKVNWESVVKILQSVSARLGRSVQAADLLPYFEAWTFRGFKPTNINWTSWAVQGNIPDPRQPPKPGTKNEPRAFEGIRRFLQNHPEEANNGNG